MVVPAVPPRHDHRLVDRRVPSQHRLHLTQLDPVAPDLHLLVPSPDVLDAAVSQVARQVPGAVQAPFGMWSEGVRHETPRRQLGPVQVPARQQRSADVQLSHHSHGHGTAPWVQDVHASPRQRTPDRNLLLLFSCLSERRRDGRFGGPVGIEQSRTGQSQLSPKLHRPRPEPLSSHDHQPQLRPASLRCARPLLRCLLPVRRPQVHHRYVLLLELLQQL